MFTFNVKAENRVTLLWCKQQLQEGVQDGWGEYKAYDFDIRGHDSRFCFLQHIVLLTIIAIVTYYSYTTLQ